ncbi:MAG TPA: GGDEF domain-containing protein [Spirochaetia bacterium]|nr:GGDEF domain-containing protein [Spirochaetia bacterium]
MKLKDLTQWHRSTALIVGFCLILIVGGADYATGYELSLSIFYLIPVSLLAWTTGKWSGLAGALLSAGVWTFADAMAGEQFSSLFFILWHGATRAGVLGTLAVLFSALRVSIEREKALGRVDHLTGAANTRSFLEILRSELDRFRRYGRPFTLAYIDLDNFKAVNDSYGHNVGDTLLQTVVSVIKSRSRTTDVVGRLGGDEFIVLFPEADQKAAQIVITQIRENILIEMGRRGWPVTVSIGALTCTDWPAGVDELIKQVDDLMYAAKVKGKNAITFYPKDTS